MTRKKVLTLISIIGFILLLSASFTSAQNPKSSANSNSNSNSNDGLNNRDMTNPQLPVNSLPISPPSPDTSSSPRSSQSTMESLNDKQSVPHLVSPPSSPLSHTSPPSEVQQTPRQVPSSSSSSRVTSPSSSLSPISSISSKSSSSSSSSTPSGSQSSSINPPPLKPLETSSDPLSEKSSSSPVSSISTSSASDTKSQTKVEFPKPPGDGSISSENVNNDSSSSSNGEFMSKRTIFLTVGVIGGVLLFTVGSLTIYKKLEQSSKTHISTWGRGRSKREKKSKKKVMTDNMDGGNLPFHLPRPKTPIKENEWRYGRLHGGESESSNMDQSNNQNFYHSYQNNYQNYQHHQQNLDIIMAYPYSEPSSSTTISNSSIPRNDRNALLSPPSSHLYSKPQDYVVSSNHQIKPKPETSTIHTPPLLITTAESAPNHYAVASTDPLYSNKTTFGYGQPHQGDYRLKNMTARPHHNPNSPHRLRPPYFGPNANGLSHLPSNPTQYGNDPTIQGKSITGMTLENRNHHPNHHQPPPTLAPSRALDASTAPQYPWNHPHPFSSTSHPYSGTTTYPENQYYDEKGPVDSFTFRHLSVYSDAGFLSPR